MWLFLAFLLVPLIEIGLFIQVGGAIGLWPTLAIVVLSAIVGTALMRSQGLHVIGQLQRALSELRDPTEPLANGAMILFAGALLITPGFFTDTIGLLLLIPPVRRFIFNHVRTRIVTTTFSSGKGPQRPDAEPETLMDVEYEDVTGKPGNSGWTKH